MLNSELRSARAELDKMERNKSRAAPPPRLSYYAPHLAASMHPHYYHPYPYAYSQPFTTSSIVPQSLPMVPAYTPLSGSVPVQLPDTSLPVLASLGIVPVPVASLPAPDQPQPPAGLRGKAANGTILSLQINVAVLQPGQINGLATLLSTLMRSGGTSSETFSSQGNPSSSGSASLAI